MMKAVAAVLLMIAVTFAVGCKPDNNDSDVFTPVILRVGLFEVGGGTFHTAAAAGGEDIEHLAAQVVGFDESVDDGRGGVPPNREADPHSVVVGDVFATALDSGTRTLVLHLDG